jgi:hypothetical protein
MPPLKFKLPGYCRRKATGQAVVAIDGYDHHLGGYGSPGSQARYDGPGDVRF